MAANTKGRIPSGREAHGAPWSLWLLAMVTIAIAALAGCTGSPPCGEANGPCCGTSCGQGFVCRTRGDAGACVSCGSIGGECCEGVNACGAGGVCAHGLCATCGAARGPCCDSTTPCLSGLQCAGGPPFSSSRCVGCGSEGEPCCGGTGCDSRLQCVAGVCLRCGVTNAPCCAVSPSCDEGNTCRGGWCETVAPPALFRACASDSACGAGRMCDLAYPGGLCTQPCATDLDCEQGRCDPIANVCRPSCALTNGDACRRYGGACAPMGTSEVCVPSCSAAPGPSEPACAPSRACDPYTGDCGSMSTGADNGAPCADDVDCKGGICLRSAGYIDGMCASEGRESMAVAGAPVPVSNCPSGSAIVPVAGNGALGTCRRSCASDDECRAGYRCDHGDEGGAAAPYFSNGICAPIDCARAGFGCPADYVCAIDAGVGRCTADTSDAGTSDASESTDATDAVIDGGFDASTE